MSKPLTPDDVGVPLLIALGFDPKTDPVISLTLRIRANRFPSIAVERYVFEEGVPRRLAKTISERYELVIKRGVLTSAELKSEPE